MPLPTPNTGESQSDFMGRCMGSDAIQEFESQDQRVAVCMSQWGRGAGNSARRWYEIRNQTDISADIHLYDEIGGWGIAADEFVRDLDAVRSATINLYINSPGGDAFGGMAIYNALNRHPAAINVTVDGIAASSASFIAQAGDRISMAKGSTMMIHEPYGVTVGNADEMMKQAEVLSKMADNIASIYAERAGGTEATWRDAMRAETWYRAQEAVDAHLADEVLGGKAKAQNRIFNLSRFQHVPAYVAKQFRNVSDDMGAMCAMPGCDMPASVEVPMCSDCAAAALGGKPMPDNRVRNAGDGDNRFGAAVESAVTRLINRDELPAYDFAGALEESLAGLGRK